MMLLLSCRDEEEGDFRYAPEKWSAKEVLGHVCDTERIFAYRALRISRADATPLEGFEQDDYVRNGPLRSVRWPIWSKSSSQCAAPRFRCCAISTKQRGSRRGIANKNEVSVRALAYIIAGHELHHRRILEEKYFLSR